MTVLAGSEYSASLVNPLANRLATAALYIAYPQDPINNLVREHPLLGRAQVIITERYLRGSPAEGLSRKSGGTSTSSLLAMWLSR